jgi:hypothetical protein
MDTAAAGRVLLVNGALALNVYWQVQGAVGMGASTVFAGTVLAGGAVTVGAGTRISGRVLSLGTITREESPSRQGHSRRLADSGPGTRRHA